MNRSKDRHIVAYCSSCREYRGRHSLRGSHSSSHDSRRIYLLDSYLEKSPIFEKRHRDIILGGAMVTGGVCSMYIQNYIIVISLVQKGRCYSEEDQRHSDRGRSPKENASRGSSPKRRMALFH
jgi:hypothetical protein